MSPEVDPFQPYADELLARASAAADALRALDQAQVDTIVECAADAAAQASEELGRLAYEETGMGVLAHKRIKNLWAARVVAEDLRGLRTVGVLRTNGGVTEIADPVGPVLVLTPVTNPTSTLIANALLCLKTRNPLVLSAHRGARKSTKEAARVMLDAALSAGAPADCIQWITKPQSEYLDRVMRHPKLGLIFATGTSGIVQTAQRTGTPTLGVGPGNVPVYVHASADLEVAARQIVHSKTFDNGTVCASEQILITDPGTGARLRPLFMARGAYVCSEAESRALDATCFDAEKRTMRAEVVGRPAPAIAALAGFEVPAGIRLLIANPGGVGREHALAHEILGPVLAWLEVPSEEDAFAACALTLKLGGEGHTLGIHASDEAVIERFSALPAARVLINQPTTDGAVGGIWNRLRPSLSLACGTRARNLTSDNLTAEHLLQIRRIARPEPNRAWMAEVDRLVRESC